MTAGDPILRYALVPKHGITGWRLNPDDGKKLEFELVPHQEPPFDYERDVIELYSDKEVKFFRQANRYLFSQGFLTEYLGEAEPVDVTNMLTDAEVLEIASTRNVNQLNSRIKDLTSLVSVQRILNAAQEIGRPAKTLELIRKRLEDLQND